jgi:hypothetical protein
LLSVLLSVFAVYLVFRQIRIMKRQTSVMERQLEIMRKQDDLLARHAELHVYAVTRVDASRVTLRMLAKNDGTSSARDFYWHVLLPTGCAAAIQSTEGSGFNEVLEGIQHTRFNGSVSLPLYPTRQTELTTISLDGAVPGKWTVLWQLASEYGKFPAAKPYGQVEIVIERTPG